VSPLHVLILCVSAAVSAVGIYALRLHLAKRHAIARNRTHATSAAEAQASIERHEAARSQPVAPWEYTLGVNGLNGRRDAGAVMVCSVSQRGRESSTFGWWVCGRGDKGPRTGVRPSKRLAEQAAERAALLIGWSVDEKIAPLPDAAFVAAETQAGMLGCRLIDCGDDWALHCGNCGSLIAAGASTEVAEYVATAGEEWPRWEAARGTDRDRLRAPCPCKRKQAARA
jgi:hypothetical protein